MELVGRKRTFESLYREKAECPRRTAPSPSRLRMPYLRRYGDGSDMMSGLGAKAGQESDPRPLASKLVEREMVNLC
jgi:hypothetical protein